MKYRFFLAAVTVIFLFMPSTSRADALSDFNSMEIASCATTCDKYVLTGPYVTTVYTWTWYLPATFDRNEEHNPPGTFIFEPIDVFTEGPLTGNEMNDLGIGRDASHDLDFDISDPMHGIVLWCNSSCSQIGVGASFAMPLWAGPLDHPVFLTGNFISLDGKYALSVTRVPEGSELAMICVAILGMLLIAVRNFSTALHAKTYPNALTIKRETVFAALPVYSFAANYEFRRPRLHDFVD
jgi:hypothetical protein